MPLAHAFVQRVAHDAGTRVLFIKGPALSLQGLRFDGLRSVDVDVLVDPGNVGSLSRALESVGWERQPTPDMPSILARHSSVHRHFFWPCEVDLHVNFPGLFADPQAVFDALWEQRSSVMLAEQPITCCAVPDHALIASLSYLRDAQLDSQQRRRRELERHLGERLSKDEKRALAHRAAELGAADTLHPLLLAIGAPSIGAGATDEADMRAWRLRTEPESMAGVPWVAALLHSPWRQRPRVLLRAVVPSEVDMRRQDASIPPGALAVWRARLRRLRVGIRRLPQAVRSVLVASRHRG